jgi:hypothetical protein
MLLSMTKIFTRFFFIQKCFLGSAKKIKINFHSINKIGHRLKKNKKKTTKKLTII